MISDGEHASTRRRCTVQRGGGGKPPGGGATGRQEDVRCNASYLAVFVYPSKRISPFPLGRISIPSADTDVSAQMCTAGQGGRHLQPAREMARDGARPWPTPPPSLPNCLPGCKIKFYYYVFEASVSNLIVTRFPTGRYHGPLRANFIFSSSIYRPLLLSRY